MNLEKTQFGIFQGKEVSQYILTNTAGTVVKIMSYGATITSVSLPKENGQMDNIVCGFDSLDEYFNPQYISNAPYFGCTVGRYSSQIKDASFTLDSVQYQLQNNCGDNNLHGGCVGFDKKNWFSEALEEETCVGVRMSILSKHLEEGFPGNVNTTVEFRLNEQNEISIKYLATTDQATPLSLTNHTYFNLSGFDRSVLDHQVQVNSNRLLEMDDSGAATGEVLEINNLVEDLRNGAIVGHCHKEMHDGFEHFYVFDNDQSELNKLATVSDSESKRSLEVWSTEPCMLFYTGKYTSDSLQRNEKEKYGKFRGFACETHRWPNGPNISNSPNSITTPDHPFQSTTIFKLK